MIFWGINAFWKLDLIYFFSIGSDFWTSLRSYWQYLDHMTQAILYSPSLLDRLLSRVSSVFIVLSRWNVDLTETSLLNVFFFFIQNRHKTIEVYNKQSLKTIQQHVSSLNVQLTKHRSVSMSPGLFVNRAGSSFAFWYCSVCECSEQKKSHLHFVTLNNKHECVLERTAIQLSVNKPVSCLPWWCRSTERSVFLQSVNIPCLYFISASG